MNANILDKDLTTLFGLDEMLEEDRNTFLDDVGMLIMESVLTKLAVGLSDKDRADMEKIMTSAAEPDDVLKTLEEKYPEVNQILKEEVEAFRAEAISVLSDDLAE